MRKMVQALKFTTLFSIICVFTATGSPSSDKLDHERRYSEATDSETSFDYVQANNYKALRQRLESNEKINLQRRRRQLFAATSRSQFNFEQYRQKTQRDTFDARLEDGWTSLYPFGKWMMDDELLGMQNRETQVNLGFDFPYYGFRFNYSMVFPGGFVSFAMPTFMPPPYTFPNPLWPKSRDHSFIAPFYADATFQYVGHTRISNVWFRTLSRPTLEVFEEVVDRQKQKEQANFRGQAASTSGQTPRVKRQLPSCNDRLLCNQVGRVIDPELLDNITRDIQEGINGAQAWRAEFAFIVTWERMAYGGAPKAVDVREFDKIKQWQNTYQLVLATDEIRSFAIFNYARLNWTTSNEAGGLNGFGGKQPAMVGFNGGNGTGWYRLPYSGEGRVWKLSHYTNVITPGRWLYRVDEEIINGGCSNESIGQLVISPDSGVLFGSIVVNVSGPCLRDDDRVKVSFEDDVIDCVKVNRIRVRCLMPMMHETGLIRMQMSRDDGRTHPYSGSFYVLAPQRAAPKVLLRDDILNVENRWHLPTADSLSLEWEWSNLTWDANAKVDVTLWGYYEDTDKPYFYMIDSITTQHSNAPGLYTFEPKKLARNMQVTDAWKHYHFGVIQVAIPDKPNEGALWSGLTPFPWYYLAEWESRLGSGWATDLCIDWYEYDGRRFNFYPILEPCPCNLEQALLDQGRFMPIFECDRDGDVSCPFHKGAYHCVMTSKPTLSTSGQQCCYDYQGYLMFSDDWEPTGDYTRFFSPATPVRAHAFGAQPYEAPTRVPGLSQFQNDLLPYYMCCVYAGHCELYYWRRQTNGCQDYVPPAAAYIYGLSHIRTYSGNEFTFPGKGFYVLAMSEDTRHQLMVQALLEQPPPPLWRPVLNVTVVTGVAMQENGTDYIEIYARYPEHRDWRYKMDIYVNGMVRFFDRPRWKLQHFDGFSIRSPARNMNQSEIIIMFDSGAGVRVQESFGMLDVAVILPQSFNNACDPSANSDCTLTRGLLGALSTKDAGLVTLDGAIVRAPENSYTEVAAKMIYEQFGLKWKIQIENDPRIGSILFGDNKQTLYNPFLFNQKDYEPQFRFDPVAINATQPFTLAEVRSECMELPQCIYDYTLMGRREVGLQTLSNRNKFVGLHERGTKQLVSCGPLAKDAGVIKTPASQNYLNGDIARFSCKPDFYLHGDEVRVCENGTWSQGWWVWCRNRDFEYGLRWVTGICTSLAVILLLGAIFYVCFRRRRRLNGRLLRRPDKKRVKTEEPPEQHVTSPLPTVRTQEDTDISPASIADV